ncbi:MAG: hypothetical protein RL754_670 [Bacteroidota bacterium]|jgi:septal ring factor EnvC (AmiA/AmiB activator)
MSTASNAKNLENAAIVIGVLAIATAAYFIFATEGNAYRMTNWIISAAFLVYVLYNFINARALKEKIEVLTSEKTALQGELSSVKSELAATNTALEESRAAHQTAQDQIASLQQQMASMQQQLDALSNGNE